MCGLAGIISFHEYWKYTQENCFQFAKYNRFRGPDNYGEKINTDNEFKYFIAHHRLAIHDLSSLANQPFTNEDNTIHLIYNGEIYNFLELKSELKLLGYVFKTQSDTEVILKAYQAWGIEKSCKKFQGMFAFAIVDEIKNTIFLARDYLGKKPLYIANTKNELYFSSDIRSFQHVLKSTLNINSLAYYFAELSTPGENTIYNEIQKLSPGSILEFSKNGIKNYTYKTINFNTQDIPSNNIQNKIEELLIQSIQKRLVADVPVGCFLSGGIDSGLITAIASLQSEKKLDTFTVGFENIIFDERPFAKLVAKKYNTNHHELLLREEDFENVDDLIVEFGEPFADASMLPSYYIAKAVSKNTKVALIGDGGDETFLGYPTYIQAYRMQEIYNKLHLLKFALPDSKNIKNQKYQNLQNIINQNPKFIARELSRSMSFNKNEIHQLLKGKNTLFAQDYFEKVLEDGKENYNTLFKAIWYGTFKTRLMNDYLVKIDRSSMFAGLEVRSPFLDDKLIEFVSQISYKNLIPHKQSKYLLRQIAQKYLPKEIMQKPKTGFEIPISEWFRGKWKDKFIDVVLNKKQSEIDLDYKFIKNIFDLHQKNRDYGNQLWTLYAFHVNINNSSTKKPDLESFSKEELNFSICINSDLNSGNVPLLDRNLKSVEKNNLMKILHIIPNLKKGGAERLVLDICNEINKRKDIKVKLITFSNSNEYEFLTKDIDWEVVPANVELSLMHKNYINVNVLQNKIDDFQPDIIHTHLYEAEIITRSCIYTKAKWFSHCHSNINTFNQNDKKIKKYIIDKFEYNYLFKNYIKNGGNNFIAISNDTLSFYKNKINNFPIFLLPNGINYDNFYNPNEIYLNSPIKLINVGSIKPIKNQEFLVDVVDHLIKNNIAVQLTILGDGENRDMLQTKINNLNLSKSISLIGNVNSVDEYLKQSHIYVHSCLSEGLGLTLIEAMAAGLPVVTLDGGGNKDLIIDDKNGYLLKTQNVEEFAKKILVIVSDKEKFQNMSQFSKQFSKQFDIKDYVDKLIEIYKI